MKIDWDVWARFIERFSADSAAVKRLGDLDENHYPDRCPFVEMMRGIKRPPEWFDVARYVGETRRFSAVFHSPLGNQSVCGGGVARPDGVLRSWQSVAGEINCRRSFQEVA